MTRNLRKRHLILWVLISAIVAVCLVFARLNTPVFEGETVLKEAIE